MQDEGSVEKATVTRRWTRWVLGGAVGLLLWPGPSVRAASDYDPNTMKLTLLADVKGFDPLQASDQYSNIAMRQVYDSLLEYEYLTRPYTLKPCLAESMPAVSEDGLTYTFKIKPGITFHDDACFPGGKGREVTAEDFVLCLKRLAEPPPAVSTGWWLFDGKIKGLNEWREKVRGIEGLARFDVPVEGLKALDRHTLQLTLTGPYPQILFVLATKYGSVYPREALEHYGKSFMDHPVGTGPFTVDPKEWTRNSVIVFHRNPNYRHEEYPAPPAESYDDYEEDRARGLYHDAGKQIPFLDKVIMNIITEDSPRWLSFTTGNSDGLAPPKDNFGSAVSPDREITPELAAKGIRLEKVAELNLIYIGLNMKDPTFGHVPGDPPEVNERRRKVRQAMSAAYDAGPYITVMRNNVTGIPAYQLIPPGIAGYDPDRRSPFRPNTREGKALARKLLAEAGYPGGKGLPEFVFEVSGSGISNRQASLIFRYEMREVGIKIRRVFNSWPTFDSKLRGGKAQIFSLAWGADYPDAQNFLQLFYTGSFPPGPNAWSYSNPEYDRLYEEIAFTVDSPERREKIGRMIDILNWDCPMIYVDHRFRYGLTHPWFFNYKYNEFDIYSFKYLRVDDTIKARIFKEHY